MTRARDRRPPRDEDDAWLNDFRLPGETEAEALARFDLTFAVKLVKLGFMSPDAFKRKYPNEDTPAYNPVRRGDGTPFPPHYEVYPDG